MDDFTFAKRNMEMIRNSRINLLLAIGNVAMSILNVIIAAVVLIRVLGHH